MMAAPRQPKPPRHLADLEPDARAEVLAGLGEKAFRGRQVAVHYFERLVADPELMSDLPKANRSAIVEALLPRLITEVRRLKCDRGATVKTVWKLFDGALVESVVMRYRDRATVCVTSQAGCGMDCPFCATGQAGLTRNLSTGEIVEQVVAAARGLARGETGEPLEDPRRLTNVVLMGMGEPLANYQAVVGALRRLTAAPHPACRSPRPS